MAKARAWHRTFRKYAASQLNSRYQETFAQEMDDEAWAGWAATKLLADVLIRAPELVNKGLIDELRTNVAFDGQKGIDMTFRDTGQLAQPLLLIENDEIKGEAPVRGVVDITDLDSLGEVSCPK
ncbi:MAG: ABC transporter substrate-binding protein [Gammaproteobacteria bacterium]